METLIEMGENWNMAGLKNVATIPLNCYYIYVYLQGKQVEELTADLGAKGYTMLYVSRF